MKILFAGSAADISLCVFRGIVSRIPICMAITHEDSTAGRGRRVKRRELALLAEEHGIPVFQPPRLNAEARRVVAGCNPDLLLCTAYGNILGPQFLGLFPRGAVNVHPSLLPRYRGPSPIQATILNADPAAGVSIHYMVQEVDAGDILAQEKIPLCGTETFTELSQTLGNTAADMLIQVVEQIETGTHTPRPQATEKVLHCSLVQKEDGRIRWNMPAYYIERMMRAYNPWPGVFAGFQDTSIKLHKGHVLLQNDYNTLLTNGKIRGGDRTSENGSILGFTEEHGILIQTGQDVLAVTRLQLAARNAMDWRSFLCGVDIITGTVLT